jgi:30S ribosomal protein S31
LLDFDPYLCTNREHWKCSIKNKIMGRGDKKTKKGKIFKGSFGKSRPANPAKAKKTAAAAAAASAEKK